MRLHLLQYITHYLQPGRKMFNLRINRMCILWAPKALLLLNQCDPWKHIHVHILWNQKYNMYSHSNFLCLKIVLLSINLGGKMKALKSDLTTKECNKISTTWMSFFWDFHCFTYSFLYLSGNSGVAAQQAHSRNNIMTFFGQMVYDFTPTLRALTSIHIYICPLFLQFKRPFREDWFHAE